MRRIRKNEVFCFIASLFIIAVVVSALYLLVFVLLGVPRSISIKVLIVIAALCANDYFLLGLRYRLADNNSEGPYSAIVRDGNNMGIIRWIKGQSPWRLFGLAFVWIILASMLIELLGDPLPDIMMGRKMIPVVLVGLIIGPIIETLFFQVFIIEAVKRITPKVDGQYNLLFPTLVSAIIFSTLHDYSFGYIVYAFFMGIGFSSLYTLVSTKSGKTWKTGFGIVLLLHLSINLLAFCGFLADHM